MPRIVTPPSIAIFASGTKDGGGSGLRRLGEAVRTGLLQATIAGVVSNRANGGVARIAEELAVPFIHMTNFEAVSYRKVVDELEPDRIALSGWLKFVAGLDGMVFNIHPGLLPQTGGLWGHAVHERVVQLARAGRITHTAVTMHFVTAEESYNSDRYDVGPTFFRFPVPIYDSDDADSLGARVNTVEHAWQAWVTNEVIHNRINWDGEDPSSLVVPDYVPLIPVERFLAS